MKNLILFVIATMIAAGGFMFYRNNASSPQIAKLNDTTNNLPQESNIQEDSPLTEVAAEKLDTPWGMVFLPDREGVNKAKRILITERSGRVRLIDENGNLQSKPAGVIDNVLETGEGGLLGITIHPDFLNNNFVYLYYTYSDNGGNTLNRIVRMKFVNGSLGDEKIIIDEIQGAANHNGGRIKFGPDGYLYITTGDAQNPSIAQDTNSLSGKILRVTDEGKNPGDNPYGNAVYSYGHRNAQGLAWDREGQLWSTEHGRSGAASGFDEINKIVKGRNYGWPLIQGDETRDDMESPILHSGANNTWAPGSAVFMNDSLFFTGLRGEALYEAKADGEKLILNEYFKGEYGRMRDVIAGPDGTLFITTSNRDGRGTPSETDDRIIKVNLRKLN